MRELTDQQRRAVTARGVSVALSAGAGCGKTLVLTERFLHHLEPTRRERPRLSQLIAITFTERAAREMRDRIRTACVERLRQCPEGEVDHWLELVREMDAARISTIHSFCRSLLASHAVEAELDPRFRVLDATQAATLLYELLDEQLRERLAARDEDVIELVVQFSLKQLYAMVQALVRRRSEIDWDRWRGESPEGLAARWESYWRSETLPRIGRQVAESAAARALLRICRECPPASGPLRDRCDFLAERLPALPQTPDIAGELAAIREQAGLGGKREKAWGSGPGYCEFRDAAAALRKLIDKQKKYAAFDADAARPAAETALGLLRVTRRVVDAYEAKKREEWRALDFDDLLIRARDLLVGPKAGPLRRRLAAQTGLLLVDEFQDTDPLQVELVRALCDGETAGGKLFFVGDYKQSIYRFRGAQPHVFQELRRSIPERGRLPLSLNFRSQPAILDFVNALFRHEMGPEYEALRPSRPQVSPTPAVEFLWVEEEHDEPNGEGDGEGEGEGKEADPAASPARIETAARRLRRREADWIARRLRAMLDAREAIVWDKAAAKRGEPRARPVEPGDVALLFRALSDVELYEEALRRHGIEYYLVGGRAFYSQQEIFDLLNLLRTLDCPADAVSLAGALRSPMFGLLDETLYWLAEHPEGLYAGLVRDELPREIDGDQRARTQRAARTLRELGAVKDRMPVAALLNEALARTGYDAVLLAEFLGQRKLANLNKLIDQARSFDRSGMFTLADFITQLSEFVARQPDEDLAATHPESTNVVRLMSIHQSKGLEFPVVVVPDLGRRRHGSTASVAFTPELGPMVKAGEAPTGLDLYRMAESDEDEAEMIRLLYVATTRAADYLILATGAKNLDKPSGPWLELLARRFDLRTGDCPDFRGARRENGTVPFRPPKVAGTRRVPSAEAETGTADGTRRVPATFDPPSIRVTLTEPPLGEERSDGGRRPDLEELIAAVRRAAAEGEGEIPPGLAPIRRDPTARRQYSFSRLTGELVSVEAIPPRDSQESLAPPSAQPAEIPATTLGELVHAVLAEIDFSAPGDVGELVRRHAAVLLPDVTDELSEPIDMIGRFLASDRARQIAAADEVYPELEFLLAWPPGSKDPDGRYLQGFIDCIYRDRRGDWRLIDYKTNRVSRETLPDVAAHYEMQLLMYALAAERILGRGPVELALCFLRPGLEYAFDWNDGARRRVVEFVDRVIASLTTTTTQTRPGR